MKLYLKKVLLIALILCGAFTSAQADGWKLTKTTVYGNGGYWENGQKSRIDCSYKNGIFSYERKTTEGKNMAVYSSRAVFTTPMKNYAPGENISVQIAFTHKGEKHGYTPYARVTVMPQNPQWTKGNGASNKIPATGTVDGQAIDASGHNTVNPPQTLTLTAKALTSGSQMAIVYSCNGMDVVYLYDWDGQAVTTNQEQEYAQTLTPEPEQNIVEEEDINVQEKTEEYSYNESDYSEPSETSETEEYSNETYQEETETYEETETNTDNGGYDYEEEEDYDEETNYDEEEDYDEEEEGAFPLTKLLIVCGVAALLIALILILFRKKKTPDEAEAMAPNQESYQQPQQQPYQQPQQQPYQQPYYEQSPAQAPYVEQPAPQSSPAFCPNCGAPLKPGEKFCQECGQRIM